MKMKTDTIKIKVDSKTIIVLKSYWLTLNDREMHAPLLPGLLQVWIGRLFLGIHCWAGISLGLGGTWMACSWWCESRCAHCPSRTTLAQSWISVAPLGSCKSFAPRKRWCTNSDSEDRKKHSHFREHFLSRAWRVKVFWFSQVND